MSYKGSLCLSDPGVGRCENGYAPNFFHDTNAPAMEIGLENRPVGNGLELGRREPRLELDIGGFMVAKESLSDKREAARPTVA